MCVGGGSLGWQWRWLLDMFLVLTEFVVEVFGDYSLLAKVNVQWWWFFPQIQLVGLVTMGISHPKLSLVVVGLQVEKDLHFQIKQFDFDFHFSFGFYLAIEKMVAKVVAMVVATVMVAVGSRVLVMGYRQRQRWGLDGGWGKGRGRSGR